MQGFELADRYGLQEADDDLHDACVAYETEAGHGTSDEAIVCEIVMQESLTLCMSLAAVMANKAYDNIEVNADVSDDELFGRPHPDTSGPPHAPSEMPPHHMHEEIVLASDDAY